jgi:putative intracellular protease/amidase
VIPGGAGGAKILAENAQVTKLVSSFYEKQKVVAFICAGNYLPFLFSQRFTVNIHVLGTIVAKAANIPEGHKVTSHPSVKQELEGSKYHQKLIWGFGTGRISANYSVYSISIFRG